MTPRDITIAYLRLAQEVHRFRCSLPEDSPLRERMRPTLNALDVLGRAVTRGARR